MLKREIDGDRAAHRAADNMRRFQLQLIHDRQEIAHRRPCLWWELRVSVTALVRPNDVEMLCEIHDLRLPHPRVCDAGVKEDDRQASAPALIVDSRAVDLH